MNDEDMIKLNEQKILVAFNQQIKIHIVLKDKSWRNGFVKELKADFFMFNDSEDGFEPLFFLDVFKVEPFMEEQ